jgi:hypothetical protein
MIGLFALAMGVVALELYFIGDQRRVYQTTGFGMITQTTSRSMCRHANQREGVSKGV